MPKFRTDDDIYRARLVYLGPPGYTLPVQLSYAQYGLFAALEVAAVVVVYLLTGDGPAAFGMGTAVAMLATSAVFRFVNPDRPARKILRTVATDWRQTQPEPAGQLPAYRTSHIRIRKAIT